jgi:hypothetical protein
MAPLQVHGLSAFGNVKTNSAFAIAFRFLLSFHHAFKGLLRRR